MNAKQDRMCEHTKTRKAGGGGISCLQLFQGGGHLTCGRPTSPRSMKSPSFGSSRRTKNIASLWRERDDLFTCMTALSMHVFACRELDTAYTDLKFRGSEPSAGTMSSCSCCSCCRVIRQRHAGGRAVCITNTKRVPRSNNGQRVPVMGVCPILASLSESNRRDGHPRNTHAQ